MNDEEAYAPVLKFCQEQLARIELRHFMVPVRFCVSLCNGAIRLDTILVVKDVRTGDPIEINNTASISCEIIFQHYTKPSDFFIKFVKKAMQEALNHELMESFHVDGVQIMNPHGVPAPVNLSKGWSEDLFAAGRKLAYDPDRLR